MNSIKGKTVCPKWGKLFIKLNYFIIFYPLVCLLSTLIVVKANLVFCYSSTCGKYFRIKSNKSILYTNFPARGIIEPEKFVKNRILLFVVKIFTRIFKYIEKIQYRKFDNIYCISTYTKKLLKEHYQLESEVLYCPTSEKFFERNKKYNDTKPFFVLVSRLEEHKNLEFVFKTFSLINEELVVIGTGKLIEKYKKLYPKIIFKGFIDDDYMIQLLTEAKASIIPTKNEYSLPIIESFARGTPVIAIKCAASDELVLMNARENNIKLGVIFNDATVKSLKTAIETINVDINNYIIDDIIKYSEMFNPSIFKKKLNIIIDNHTN